MASVNIIQLTDSYVRIRLESLPTGRTLYINAILWDSSGSLIYNDPYQTYLYNDYYEIEFSPLNASSSYDYRFTICYDNYYDDGGTLVDWLNGNFTTTGGGGGTTPTYIISTSGNSVYINILNADLSYNRIYTYLNYSSGGRVDYHSLSNTDNDSYSGLADGTYVISVEYKDDNIDWTYLKNDYTGQDITEFTIGSGPSPSGDWNYGSPIYLDNLMANYTSSSAYSFKYDNGALFVITFAYSGQARFYSSNEYGDMVAFLGDTNSGFNNSNGVPIDYDRSSRLQNGFNIDFYSVTAGTPYYLWVTAGGSEKTNWGTFYLNIVVPTAPVVYPTYTYSVNNNQVTFNVQNRGNYYLSYIARLASDSSDRTYTLYYTTNAQVTTTELLWNTTYLINVGYSEAINGNIEWIGSNQVTIGANPQSGYVYIYDGSNWRKAKPYIYDGDRWRPATAYIYDGNSWKKTTG